MESRFTSLSSPAAARPGWRAVCLAASLALVATVTAPANETVDARMLSMVQTNVSNPWPTTGLWHLSCYALAALHLNTDVANANAKIIEFCTSAPVPDDTTSAIPSYFMLHLLWRIYLDPAMNSRLTPEARTQIELTMWRWIRTRSKISDAQDSVWKIHDSENHNAMRKAGHLLCAEALRKVPGYGPDRLLADGKTIAEHAAAWTGYFLRYFPSRAREGINVEIASPQYARYTVGAYYNLMDFADSPALRAVARKFIDLYWADTASDWTSSGVRGGGETRCFKDAYLRLGGQYAFYAVLWAYGWHANASTGRTYALIPATSSYRVPEIITASASGPARPNFLYTSRRFGRGGAWDSNKNYTVVFDNGNSNLRRDTFVTPDYSMGTFTVDMNRDYIALIDQSRAMGVFFASGPNDRIMVFGKGSPSNPTISFADISGVTRENCMVVQRDQNANGGDNATHVFISQSVWNNRVETGGWLFTRAGNAYAAIKPAGGGYSTVNASYGQEMILGNMWAPVVIQTGQAGDYASFEAFQESVMANAFTFVSNTLNYTSEAGDTFTVYANSKTTPRINGTTVNLNPAKTYDSPYLSMVHGEVKATVSHPGHPDLVLDFGAGSSGFIEVTASAQRFQSTNSPTHTLASFTVAPGEHRKLVLAASWESTNSDISATWNGTETFSLAVKRSSGRTSAILYLDNPSPGTGDIVVTFGSSVASRVGVVSLVGAAGGVATTSSATGRSGSLATPVDHSWVIGAYTSNDLPTITGPFATTLYNGNSGSSAGNSGYQVAPVAGLLECTWTVSAPNGDNHVLAAFAPAAAVPTIMATVPANGATNVPVGSNLVATFNQSVVPGTGMVTLRRSADDSVVESFDVESSPRISFSGATITIDPTHHLDPSAGYYVTMDATAVVGIVGIPFQGLSGKTAWSFTAAGIRVIASASNAITTQTGNANTITGFTVAAGSKLVLAASWEEPNPGISATWNGSEPFTVAVNSAGGRNSAILYLDNPTPGTGNIVVTFAAPTGSRVGVLSVLDAAPGVAQTSNRNGPIGSLDLPVDGCLVVGVYTSNDFPTIAGPFANTLYNGNSGSSTGHAGHQVIPSSGIGDFAWTVSAPTGDNHVLAAFVPSAAAPVIVAKTPAADANGVEVDTNLVATFSEPVMAGGSGAIWLRKSSDNSTVESFDVNSSPRLTFNGQMLTVDPTNDLAAGTSYHLLIDPGAIIDTTGGNPFPGISSADEWNFTTRAGGTFSDWIAAHPGVGGLTGVDDDPDGDGIPNGVENFFGTAPDAFSRGLLVTMVSGNQFIFTHPQGTLAGDLTQTYRWSTDLQSFHGDGETVGGTTVGFSRAPDPVVAGTETTVTATITGTPVERLFVIVEVMQNRNERIRSGPE
jgi:hypothetical protein